MIQSAETGPDGSTLVVRIPMRFQRRGGRKRIVAPDGGEIVPHRNRATAVGAQAPEELRLHFDRAAGGGRLVSL